MDFSNSVKRLTLFPLIMLMAGSIDSIRNLPAMALFGSTLIFFFVFAAIVFLLPVALVSAELSACFSEESGIYNWVNLAFGERWAFLGIWLQWINTVVWYPTILSFIAATLAFLIDPQLAEQKFYLVSVIMLTFWLLTLVNLRGLKTSGWFATVCTIVGMLIPMALIITLAIFWAAKGHPVEILLNQHTLVPSLGHGASWISLTAIMTSFLGIELATVHVKNVVNVQRTFPRAMFFVVLIIVVTIVLGALSIAVVIPHNEINLVDGVMEAFQYFFRGFGLHGLVPLMAIMLLIGALGGMINWIISPAKGLLHAAQHGYLPNILRKENDNGVASVVLILQAILVSLLCLAFLLMPTINASYWLLTDLSTQMYMFMYVLMFIAAIRLSYKYPDKERPFRVPGGRFGMWITCLLGLIGCGVTITVGFFPPDSINVGGFWHYETMFVGGLVVMILPIFLFYGYRMATTSS